MKMKKIALGALAVIVVAAGIFSTIQAYRLAEENERTRRERDRAEHAVAGIRVERERLRRAAIQVVDVGRAEAGPAEAGLPEVGLPQVTREFQKLGLEREIKELDRRITAVLDQINVTTGTFQVVPEALNLHDELAHGLDRLILLFEHYTPETNAAASMWAGVNKLFQNGRAPSALSRWSSSRLPIDTTKW